MRLATVMVLALAAWVGSACGEPASKPAPSAKPSTTSSSSPAGSPSGVSLPSGFPTDFPIYTGSRLNQAGSFTSNGSTTWGLEWQTPDGASKVQQFFAGKLNADDWALLASSGTATTSYSDSFRRKSDSRTSGTLRIATSAGVTKISLVLTIP